MFRLLNCLGNWKNVIVTFDYGNRYIFIFSVNLEHTTNQGTENRKLWSASPKFGSYIHTNSSILGEKGEKVCKSQRQVNDYSGAVFQNEAVSQMDLQQLR